MSLLKGNYELEDDVPVAKEAIDDGELLEQEYYQAALQKLGGSIAFVMKDNTFLWTGDGDEDKAPPSTDAVVEDESAKN